MLVLQRYLELLEKIDLIMVYLRRLEQYLAKYCSNNSK